MHAHEYERLSNQLEAIETGRRAAETEGFAYTLDRAVQTLAPYPDVAALRARWEERGGDSGSGGGRLVIKRTATTQTGDDLGWSGEPGLVGVEVGSASRLSGSNLGRSWDSSADQPALLFHAAVQTDEVHVEGLLEWTEREERLRADVAALLVAEAPPAGQDEASSDDSVAPVEMATASTQTPRRARLLEGLPAASAGAGSSSGSGSPGLDSDSGLGQAAGASLGRSPSSSSSSSVDWVFDPLRMDIRVNVVVDDTQRDLNSHAAGERAAATRAHNALSATLRDMADDDTLDQVSSLVTRMNSRIAQVGGFPLTVLLRLAGPVVGRAWPTMVPPPLSVPPPFLLHLCLCCFHL